MTSPDIARAIPVTNLPKEALQGNGSIGRGELQVGQDVLRIRQTTDFPLTDGWSRGKRVVVDARRTRGDFRRRPVLEAGVGDGRNLLVAGVHLEPGNSTAVVSGVDLDPWRAGLARENLLAAGVPENRLDIRVGDAIADLQARRSGDLVEGSYLACLPQAPGIETQNHADGIDPTLKTLDATRDLPLGPQSVDTYGLSLNAAFLDALRNNVHEPNSDVQVTISGRVPAAVRGSLFTETGWQVVEVHGGMVQQDADTGVSYVGKYAEELDPDEGDGFFERRRGGLYTPIFANEAEERRQDYVLGRTDNLNVHHNVFEYIAVPSDRPKN